MKASVVIYLCALAGATVAGKSREKRGFLTSLNDGELIVGSAISYEAPSVSYATPSISYASPALDYVAPGISYSAPSVSYAEPLISYAAPSIYYAAPSISYAAAPAVSYSVHSAAASYAPSYASGW